MRALLIVDVQVDFCEGGSLAVAGGAQVARDISAYVRDHHRGYGLIVTSQDWHTADSTNGGHIALPPASPDFVGSWPVHCVAGTGGADFHPELDTTFVSHEVHKGMGEPGYSAFEGVLVPAGTERLADLLRGHEVTDLDVAGIATDFCVRASGLDARREGFAVRVLPTLAAGVDPESSARALLDLQAAGAAVI